MKNIRNKFLALLLITSVAFLSCKKEDHFSPSASNTASRTLSHVDWQITLFQVGEYDETNFFNEYRFKFAKDGTLLAVIDGGSEHGTWSLGKNNKIHIMFPSAPLSKLNRGWSIVRQTATELKLENVNRSGALEYLNFQRNQRLTETGQIE